MSSLLVSTAQNLLNPEPEDIFLDEVYGSLSIGDICRYNLSVIVVLPYKDIAESNFNEDSNYFIEKNINADLDTSILNSPEAIKPLNSKNSNIDQNFVQRGWDLTSVPKKLLITTINTSPIHKNLSLLKKEGPYSLSVLVKPEIEAKSSHKFFKTKKNSKQDDSIDYSKNHDPDFRISNKKLSRNSRLKEKPASCLAILCGGSWSTRVPP
ncbi:hypothetical protein AYI70_g9771, partial [Smittium culicis]